MRAIVLREYGGPDVLEIKDVPKPTIKGNELLVKIMTTGINPLDTKVRKYGAWAKVNPGDIIGWDAAGIVEEVGSEVKDFKVGDEVFYAQQLFQNKATYAEYDAVDAEICAHKPKNITWAEAGGLSLAGATAYQGLVDHARLQKGETVLIHGASGGVGVFAIQIAKYLGAKVIATSSPKSLEFVKNLGADVVIDYKNQNFVEIVNKETNGKGAEVVYDLVGGETVKNSFPCTAFYGRIVTIVNAKGDLNDAMFKNLSIHFEFSPRNKKSQNFLKTICEEGKLVIPVYKTFPLEEASKAHSTMEAGGLQGKIVLVVHEN